MFLCNKGVFPLTVSEWKSLDLGKIETYYSEHIRGNLFAGLIAVAGFLLTGKTFILVTMKQNVFDDPKYQEEVKKQSKLDENISLMKPLIELKDILYHGVLLTITAAVVQLTLGLVPHWSFSLLSLYIAIAGIVLVIDGLNLIKKNLDFWIKEGEV